MNFVTSRAAPLDIVAPVTQGSSKSSSVKLYIMILHFVYYIVYCIPMIVTRTHSPIMFCYMLYHCFFVTCPVTYVFHATSSMVPQPGIFFSLFFSLACGVIICNNIQLTYYFVYEYPITFIHSFLFILFSPHASYWLISPRFISFISPFYAKHFRNNLFCSSALRRFE